MSKRSIRKIRHRDELQPLFDELGTEAATKQVMAERHAKHVAKTVRATRARPSYRPEDKIGVAYWQDVASGYGVVLG